MWFAAISARGIQERNMRRDIGFQLVPASKSTVERSATRGVSKFLDSRFDAFLLSPSNELRGSGEHQLRAGVERRASGSDRPAHVRARACHHPADRLP
jgi:hypothetical protein